MNPLGKMFKEMPAYKVAPLPLDINSILYKSDVNRKLQLKAEMSHNLI